MIPSSDMPFDTMFPVSDAAISEDAKKGASGTPIPMEDLASNTLKSFGIGKGDGGPTIEEMGSGNPGHAL
jgi:hypothetical protein